MIKHDQMVLEPAVELAVINGRSAHDASKSAWAQANRELTAEPDTDPKEASLESASESERWDPVPGHETRIEQTEVRTEQAMRRGGGFLEKPFLQEHFLTSLSPRADGGPAKFEARPIVD
jgi:hypothetical protein